MSNDNGNKTIPEWEKLGIPEDDDAEPEDAGHEEE